MTGHALEVLEFERVLERVARRASSDAGKARILALRPKTEVRDVERELTRVAATIRFLSATSNWHPGPIPDVAGALAQLPVEGALLDPVSIHRLGLLLGSSRSLLGEFRRHEGGYAELDALIDRLVELPELERAVDACVDDEGNVLSSASVDLKKIRDRLRGAHAKIVRSLEKYLRTLPERFVVPDASITIREGRYVVPVRREGKGEVGGIVHDESQTGATLYVEPPLAIEAMNQLRDLEREEAREIRRVLGAMTERFAPEHAALEGALDALIDFDSLWGRARTARAWDSVTPTVTSASSGRVLTLCGARHPLLVEAGDGEVIPYDLTLDADEFCVVVSGPNTGGKSVFLKATGLITALAQSGVVPPVGPGTSLPVFGSFFADIGDEQSIARNLSTFSAHLANLSEIVSAADDTSLVLIDEMGTGTDPAEGAALSRAVIEELVGRGATMFVSSHLGDLKLLDAEGSGIVNASLQFDGTRMQPTYHFQKGRPGRSYGLAIARRLGFPAGVLDRADEYRDSGTAGMEELLERLELREREVEGLLLELEGARARTERLQVDVEARSVTLAAAEKTADDRARSDARKLLMDARAEVEEAISELKSAAEEGRSLEEAAREARRRVERAAGRQTSRGGSRRSSRGVARVDAGDSVRIEATGARGTVVEVRGGRATVEAGALRFEVPTGDLVVVESDGSGKRTKPRGGGWKGPPKGQAKLEVDFRGMRVDEIDLELGRALDEALLEDLEQLRIIHGKGTGALRKRVGELLQADGRVRSFRMGGPTEGGAGVTVADFGRRG